MLLLSGMLGQQEVDLIAKYNMQAQAPTPISYQSAQLFANQPQQAPPSIGSQGSGQGRFQFQPLGQPMSPSSNSTPSLSGRSVKAMPAFLEEAWARGEPGPSNARPSPPPLPGTVFEPVMPRCSPRWTEAEMQCKLEEDEPVWSCNAMTSMNRCEYRVSDVC